MFRSTGLVLATLLLPSVAMAEGKSIIVLDGSGSMWGQIDGRAKLEIAREALGQVLSGLPADTEIGLMAYGHRTKGDCNDIELIVPPAKGTAQAITDAANAMKFLGKTPLTEAVRQAAADLRSTEEKATVILITDGIETCNADPCALGTELEQSGVDFTAHVVGFGLTEEEGKAVACLAENTGGKYIQAADASSLVEALQTAVAEPPPAPEPSPAPEPAVLEDNVALTLRLAPGGAEVDGRLLSDTYFEFWSLRPDGAPDEVVHSLAGELAGQIPAGKYIMRTTLHNVVVEQPIELSETDLTKAEVILDAGVLSLQILSEEGGTPDPDAGWEMRGAGGIQNAGFEQTFRAFPAGEYELEVKLGEMRAKESVVITAGEVLEKTIVLGVGVPVFTAYYAEGVPVETDQSFEIVAAKPGVDGLRESIRTDYGAGSDPQMPPGDYVVIAKVGEAVVERPFTVKPGQRFEVPVILNAGIAAISAPNGDAIEIFGAKKGLDGQRSSVRTDYGDSLEITLPAGDYVASARAGEASAETLFSIKPAERMDVTVTIAAGMAAISAPGVTEIEILGAKTGLDGKRPSIRSDYGEATERMLPPGDYIASARAGLAIAEVPFTVKDGERTEVSVVVPFGVVAVSAPGAREISIYETKVGIDGKRPYLRGDYGETSDSTLPPGDYVAVADFGDGISAEAPVTLPDGQRVEVTIAKP